MTKNELSQRTVPELKALAKELGIAVKGRRKDDIIAEILKPGKKAAPAAGRKAPVKPAKAAKPGRKSAAKKAPPAARAVAPAPSYRKKDLEEKTVPELKAIAKELGAVVKGRRKDDIIAEVLKAARRLGAKAPGVTRKARKVSVVGAAKPPERAGAKVPAKEKIKPEAAARPRVRAERPAPPAPAKPAATKPAPAKPAPSGGKPVTERPAPPEEAWGKPFEKPRGHYEIGAVMPSAPGMREAPAEEAVVDRLAAIVVDPRQIFVSWQLRGAALREGVPAIRVYDSTGVAFSAGRAGSFFDLPLHAASGSAYVDVVPGTELFVALGVTGPGGVFSPKRTTGRLFVPREKAPEGRAVLPEQYFTFRPPHY